MLWIPNIDALTLEADQQEVVDAIMADKSGACLVVGDLGSGKTVIGVEAALGLQAMRVLIICPLRNTLGFYRPDSRKKYDGWVGTLRRQGYQGPITVVKTRDQLETEDHGVFIMSRELAATITSGSKKRDGTVSRPEWSWSKAPEFDLVIFDEVHRLQNRKSVSFSAVKNIKTKYKVGLSGTPWGNSFDGAWAVTKWHWPDRIDNSFWRWVYSYCVQVDEVIYKNVGGKLVKQVVKRITGEQEPGRFVSELPNYHRIEREYDTYSHQIYVELTPKQRKVYDAMLEDMFVWLDENPMVAKLPIEKRIRLREMSLGVPSLIPNAYYDAKKDEFKDVVYFEEDTQSAKLESLKEFLSDHDEPALILTHSKKFAKVAAARLGPRAGLYTGDQSDAERADIKDKFLSGEYKYIVATIATIAEGMDGLQDVCRMALFLSRHDSRILNEQVIGRLARRGQNSQVLIVDFLAEDTFDMLSLDEQNDAGAEYLRGLRKKEVTNG